MKHILVIDDDVNLLKLIELQLVQKNYSIITALNGNLGYDLAVQGNPDLILLDIMMPVMDGFEVLKKLQKNAETRNIPVIMLSAKSGRDDVTTAMQMGVVDYIVKPYSIDMLSRKIEVAFKYKQLRSDESSDGQNIIVKRDSGRTVVLFMERLFSKKFSEEMRSVFNRGFISLTQKDIMIIDLRLLDDLDERDMPVLTAILELLSSRVVYVVAGRHYGVIASNGNFDDDKVRIFISSGDLELELEKDHA